MEASDQTSAPSAPWATEESTPAEADAFAERPEVFVGAAFAGGLALAVTLRWLGNR